MIVDEEGIHRIKGKNETDHNTIMMSLRINDARKPTFEEKWMLNNKEGWKKFNKTIQEAYSKNKINTNDYQKTEKDIIKILKETIGSRKIRTDKPWKNRNPEIKECRRNMIRKKKGIPKSMPDRRLWGKTWAKFRYMASQKELRNAIEQANIKTIEDRLKKLQKKAKITPNAIWEARKRAKGCKGLEYNTYTENEILITDPTAPKNTRAGLST